MRPQTSKTGKLRTILTGRKMRYGTNAVVLTIAVVAIVLMVNVLAGRHSRKLDLTQNRFYTLSEATCEFLRGLDQRVKITAFFPEDDAMGEVVRDLLREYTRISPKIEVEFVDPDKMPSVAKQYDITAYGTSVVEAGLQSRKVMEYELIDYETTGDMVNFSGEQAFTRALVSLFTEDTRQVYFSTGHDERTLTGDYLQAKAFLEGEGYVTATLNLSTEGRVPEDAAVLVIAGPARDFTQEEAHAVQAYLKEGGKVVVALDPSGQKGDLMNLKGILRTWGIGVNDDLVIDPGSHYFLDMAGLIPEIQPHPITEKLITKDLSIFLPRSRSLYYAEEGKIQGITAEPILNTTGKAWGETDFTNEAVFDRNTDIEGPLTLAYAASMQGSDSVLIVVGNASFLDNDIVTFQGNIDFFMNAVGWMVGKEDSISIRAKAPSFEQVYLSDRQAKSVFYGTVMVIPMCFALLGVGVWVRRRNL
ncbi:MAG TPA: GldG family protein [Firmicutes bacterium]|nr:GldG family protein [Bacillota bacterium]